MSDLKGRLCCCRRAGRICSALDIFAERWDKKYLKISRFWKANWVNLSTYFKYPQEIRKLIYTANTIEGFNRQLHKVTKAKPVFPTNDILQKILHLAMIDITKNGQDGAGTGT